MNRPIEKKDVVRITSGTMEGKTGVVVRTGEVNCCVVLTGVWEHGIWFFREDMKRIGKVKK